MNGLSLNRRNAVGLLAAAALVPLSARSATVFPAGPFKVIVPYSPGTGPDILARLIMDDVGRRLGQPAVIDNRTGASGNIGTSQIAKAPADGHTIGIVTNAFAMNPHMGKVGYDPLRDFSPIGLVARNSLVLVAKPSLDVRDIGGFAQLARAQPNKLNYGSPGNGSPQHLAIAMMEHMLGISLMHIPYRGTGPSIAGMIAGEVDCMFMAPAAAAPLVQQGRIKALAVSTGRRHPLLPDVPTAEESGLKGFDVDLWYALLAPARTPPEVMKVLRDEVEKTLNQPAMQADLRQKGGLDPVFMAAAQFEVLLKRDLDRWAAVVKRAKITAD